MRSRLSMVLITIALVAGCSPGATAAPADSGTGMHTGEVVAPAPTAPFAHPVSDPVFLRVGGCVLVVAEGRKRAPTICP